MNSETHPEPQSGTETAAPARTRSNGFVRKARTPLPRDDARRQGNISQLAWLTLGGTKTESGPQNAIGFLNTENPALGGRPLAIATASDEGYARVAAAIRAQAAAPVTP